MFYDVSRKDVKRILTSANILNTLNGGMAESQITVNRDAHEYHVAVTLPGIDENKLKVEIAEKHLIVSHLMDFEGEKGETLVVPHVVAACPLSLDIDHDRITAEYHDGLLDVKLPLSDFTSGYRREINITRD